MKLSLCLLAHNDGEFIHYPLDSAYKLADEVILVDAESEDNTIELAKKYGDKIRIISAKNVPMFHENKQKALDAAMGDWILQLDADEAVSPELAKEIIETINKPDAKNAYWIPRKNWFLNRFLMKGGQYPDYTIRLYKRGKAHFPCKSVHEQVEVEGGEAETGKLENALEHYSDPTFARYVMRWNRYTTLDGQDLAKVKKHLSAGDFIMYFLIKPTHWFLLTYLRHKGFMDGFPGFVFSLFSALRFWAIYVKAWAVLHRK